MLISAIMLADSLKVIIDKQFFTVTKSDPRLPDILKKIEHAQEGQELGADVTPVVEELVNMFQPLRIFLKNSSDIFEVLDGQIYHVDHKDVPLPAELAGTVQQYCNNGFPIKALANFWVKLVKNPNEHSREQFYKWLEKNEITITQDGDALMYKAVRKYEHTGKVVNFGEPGWKIDGQGVIVDKEGNPVMEITLRKDVCDVEYVDIHSGTFNNTPGLKVKMDRSLCDANAGAHCSAGLHCSTLSYARSFGRHDDVIIIVKVDPANVVSVPNDMFEKIRVCEYDVLGVYEVISYVSKGEMPGYVNLQTEEEEEGWEEDNENEEESWKEDTVADAALFIDKSLNVDVEALVEGQDSGFPIGTWVRPNVSRPWRGLSGPRYQTISKRNDLGYYMVRNDDNMAILIHEEDLMVVSW